MQALQPEMTKINEKYKGISMSDPRAANKQQEMMDLYKKHGVNPMGGCIPLLIQMPFIYAFYKVLAVSIEMRHASWLWVGDLSQHEHFEIHFLPAHHGGHQLRAAAHDADARGGRSQPAENDAVYAAHVPVLLLVAVERSGVILAHWQYRRACSAVVFQQDGGSR